MRWLLSGCGRHRENICLLAGGALEEQERAAVESHLATCAGCQKYYGEIKRVAMPLVHWEKAVSHLEPDQTIRARWAKDFQAALEPHAPWESGFLPGILDWCHDMIWPCRRIWAGFAATWWWLLGVNFSTRDASQSLAAKSSRPSPEMVRAYLAGGGYLARWSKAIESNAAEAPKASLPAPRSERRSKGVGA